MKSIKKKWENFTKDKNNVIGNTKHRENLLGLYIVGNGEHTMIILVYQIGCNTSIQPDHILILWIIVICI